MLPLMLIRPIGRFAATLLFFVYAGTQTVNAETFTNFLGMTFVSVPGGSFKMGAASKTSDVKLDELPQHTVEVPAFQLMSTEVTLAQYKRYIIESKRIDILQDEFMEANARDENAPVVFVSWNDVRLFLHWLNENKPDSDPGDYMLPTEAEWEYACRAGGDDLYCGGETANAVAWYSSPYQQPVARKKANFYALYDMSGNVREWVKDCYHANYKSAPTDGREWAKDCHAVNYVTRGGSWDEGPKASRSTDRVGARFNRRDPTIGFRVARKVPSE